MSSPLPLSHRPSLTSTTSLNEPPDPPDRVADHTDHLHHLDTHDPTQPLRSFRMSLDVDPSGSQGQGREAVQRDEEVPAFTFAQRRDGVVVSAVAVVVIRVCCARSMPPSSSSKPPPLVRSPDTNRDRDRHRRTPDVPVIISPSPDSLNLVYLEVAGGNVVLSALCPIDT